MIVLDKNNKIITPGARIAYYCRREYRVVEATVVAIREALFRPPYSKPCITTKLTIDADWGACRRTLSRTVSKNGGYTIFDKVMIID